MVQHIREIDARAHRNEEQPEQQPFEGFDVGFELVPVFAFESTTPAMNVPSAAEMPTDCISSAMPTTNPRAVAVNISRRPVPAM